MPLTLEMIRAALGPEDYAETPGDHVERFWSLHYHASETNGAEQHREFLAKLEALGFVRQHAMYPTSLVSITYRTLERWNQWAAFVTITGVIIIDYSTLATEEHA